MKIIDLLNKLANSEEVPKKIKYCDEIFQFTGYNSASKNYQNELEDLFEVLDGSILNDEIEILEEQKKIPEKLENEQKFYSYVRYEENKDEIDKVLYILKAINLIEEKIGHLNNSINEVIDYLDYLKSKGE